MSYWDPKFSYNKKKKNTGKAGKVNPRAIIQGPQEEVRVYDKNGNLKKIIPATGPREPQTLPRAYRRTAKTTK